MALCYVGGHGSTDDPATPARRRVRPGHATLTIRAVDPVETLQVPDRCRYDSTVLHRFALATTEAAATMPADIGQGASV